VLVDVNTSRAPQEGAHSLSWLNGLIIIIIGDYPCLDGYPLEMILGDLIYPYTTLIYHVAIVVYILVDARQPIGLERKNY
jgi:hypothetical protein